MKHTLILPSGRKISSGAAGPAICTLKLTRQVNAEDCLAPGTVASACLEAELFDPEGLALQPGDAVTLAEGSFTLEEVRRRGSRLQLRGYDCVSRLDRDLTAWLEGLEGWPYTLRDFSQMVCAACGLTLADAPIPNGDYPIRAFRASHITGRQLMQWAAQAACRFLVATGPDTVALSWYEDSGIAIEKSGPSFCYQGSLSLGQPIPGPGAVVLRRTEQDVGVAAGSGENPLYITGNYLLTQADQAVAANILSQLQLPHTPCTFETPVAVAPGQLLRVDGKPVLAMAVEHTGSRYRVRCFGAYSQERRPQGIYQALAGRTAELELGLEGISAQLSRVEGTAENAAALSVTVDALNSRISAAETQAGVLTRHATELTQRSDALELRILQSVSALDAKADKAAVQDMAVHFRFDADGLTIGDSATGMGLGISQEKVAFTGGTDPTTVITPQAMTTTELSVARSLTLGRFTLFPRTSGNLSLRCTSEE